MRIGVTGQIGSGKSTAAQILGSFGAAVISADEIGREVVDGSASLRKRLARRFGRDILDKNCCLIRKRLATKAFANQEATAALNEIVHPRLLSELRRQVKRLEKTNSVVVVDAALLLYWNLDREMDCTLVIHAGQETRLARALERGISRSDALSRQRAQLPFSAFRSRADRLLLNSGSVADLTRKLSDWYQKVCRD
jgi:dephospho-CoA kinase